MQAELPRAIKYQLSARASLVLQSLKHVHVQFDFQVAPIIYFPRYKTFIYIFNTTDFAEIIEFKM